MRDIDLITTSDGSHSLLNTKVGETYHSVHGAIRESDHVFIKHGLQYFEGREHSPAIRILEVGFGTGLNALLALNYAQKSLARISYTALEPFPLEKELVEQLNYPSMTNSASKDSFNRLHDAVWNQETTIDDHFILIKKMIEVQKWDPGTDHFDVVFYDAFAPSRQPEMWEISVLKKIHEAMARRGVFVTYCAKGQLKRDLKSLEMTVETLAGPPGKKEMVRATKS